MVFLHIVILELRSDEFKGHEKIANKAAAFINVHAFLWWLARHLTLSCYATEVALA